jgi:hypothetical protein
MDSKVITILFPIILIILDVCAGIVYGINLDFKRMLYWFFAAGLTICVTI